MKKRLLILLLPVILIMAFIYYPGEATGNHMRLKVLGQTDFLSGGNAGLRIIALDEKGEKPLENIKIIVNFISDKVKKKLFSGITDSSGSINASFKIPPTASGKAQLSVIASTETEKKEISFDVNITKSYQLLLTTDKPLYQPGQTINLRLLTLSRPDMEPVTELPVTFEIQDAKGNKVFKDEGKLSKFGVASAKFNLADEVNMGEYHIKAIVEKEEIEKNVTVKRYVLPKFNNSVKSDKDYYQPGQTVKGTVESRYFFGKPVSNGEVNITFSTVDVQENKLSEINGKTDKEGFYTFEYKLPDYFTGLPLEGGKAVLDMEIKVTDSAKHQEITHKSLPVVKDPVQITVVPESASLIPGVDNSVYILTCYPDGSPARTDLEIIINNKSEKIKTDDTGFVEVYIKPEHEQTSYEIKCSDEKGNSASSKGIFQTGSGEQVLLRTDKALYRTGEAIKLNVFSTGQEGTVYLDIIRDSQTILTKSMEIKSGRGNLEWELSPDCGGSLTLHAYRITPDGQIIRDTRKIVVSSANDLDISVTMNKGVYLPGEDGEIKFKVVNKAGKPVLSVLGVDIVDESLFALADRKPGFEKLYFLLEAELLEPKYEIHGIEFSDLVTGFEEGKDKDNTQRLSKIILKGAPSGEAFTLNKDSFLEDLKNLYKNFNNIYNGMNLFYGSNNRYPSTVSEMIKGKYLLKDTYLKEEETIDPWGNPIYISGGGGTGYPGLISFGPDGKKGTDDDINYNNIYQLLQSYIPYTDPFWDQAGWFANEEGARGVLKAEAFAGAPPPVPPMAAIPSDISVTKGGSAPEAPARVREYFPETLYTNPEVITDEKGIGKINVKMADSITTWRLTSFASSLKGEMGNKQSGIKVFQDFFADIDLPVFLTQDDEISIPVAVYNYLPEKQTVKLELLKDNWFKLLDESVKNITLEKDQVSVVYFRIKAKDVGTHPLTVYAKGSEMSDAIKRTIQIEPNGKLFIETQSDRLTESMSKTVEIPKEAIKGASKILVTLYPGLFSQVVEGLDKILRMPSGCFEQTSSSTYPNVLVLDYLKRVNKVTPEIQMKAEAYINNGYQRLLTFEVKGGGFSWFGDAPANKLLTAFGIMEFKDMAKVHSVDPALIKRTQDWLSGQQLQDGSWKPDESYLHAESWAKLQNSNLLVTAYITWALLDTGYENKAVTDRAVSYIKGHYTEAKDPYMLSVIANALSSYDKSDPVLKNVFKTLIDMKKEGKNTVYWESSLESITFSTGISSTVETTALVTYAMLKSNLYPDLVNKSITFLIQNKDPYGTWHSTQPTILTLRTLLLAAEKATEEVNVAGSILINGKKFKDFNITSKNFDVYQQFDLGTVTGRNDVEIKFEGRGNCLYQIVTKYYLPWTMIKEEAKSAMSIKVSYDKTKLVQNDLVTCKAQIANNTKGDIKMTIIDLGIPPGFTVESDGLEKLVTNKVIEKYSLTGRQVIIYIDEIKGGQSLEVSYQLRAKYPVKVQAPRSQVYEYYKPENVTTTKPVEMIVE